MSLGKARPIVEAVTAQQLGFNLGQTSNAEWARFLENDGQLSSFYFDNVSQNGMIDPTTGYPTGGTTRITIQLRAGTRYPVGNYTVSWDGDGTLDGQTSPLTLSVVFQTSKTYVVNGSITNFQMSRDDAGGAMYTPTFTLRATGCACIRWMEVLRTNEDGGTGGAIFDPANPWVRERIVSGANTFYHRVPTPPLIGQTCNDFGCAPWVCLHHKYDGGVLFDLITGIRSNYPTGPIYLEFSNETWNSDFPQYDWILDYANTSGNYTSAPGDAAKVNAATADLADIMAEGAKAIDSNVVCIVGSQTATPNRRNQMYAYGVRAPFPNLDAYAISGYYGGPPSRALTQEQALALDGQGLADLARNDWLTRVIPDVNTWKGYANADNFLLYCYEGPSSHCDNADPVAEVHLAGLAQSAEMGVLQGETFDWWHSNIGELANLFQDVGNPSDPWSYLHGELGPVSPRLQAYLDRI